MKRVVALLFLVFLMTAPAAGVPPGTVRVPAGIDVGPWQALLERHVDSRGLVDYAAWKSSPDDLRRLDEFVAAYSRVGVAEAEGSERIAALINAYNAFTIRWILRNYPTESIRELDGSWDKARWDIGGSIVSLDEIEHQQLRPVYGWRVHATIVCAARSCPPLLREAYTASNLSRLTEHAYRAWFEREDLNVIDEAAGRVRVSAIFKWFQEDFSGDGEIAAILERYGPPRHRQFLGTRRYRLGYLDYHWGLNDQGGRGRSYKQGLFGRLF